MKQWGLVHSMLVIVPVSEMGLFASYSTPNEWCARAGALAPSASTIPAKQIARGLNFITHSPEVGSAYPRAQCRSSAPASLPFVFVPGADAWRDVAMHFISG
jgi:hypothetical protein